MISYPVDGTHPSAFESSYYGSQDIWSDDDSQPCQTLRTGVSADTRHPPALLVFSSGL